ncbi:unnamed protein product [Clonostachys chloroleuca]|uniref:Suppressor of anucleate metulae protein B n=1 Tax=Clonostachys chloroleuca TaxID=1926264 RepID=A0AA35MA73_9HYPO|nr:unnamed protein product [Clonostachys chloroleuca]
MDAWLNKSGAVGLGDLDLADFPETGRGVKAQRPFKEGERILTIPANCLWTVKGAYADPLFGPVLQSVQPPLSVEDTLALYILFVRSRVGDPAYAERQSHVAVLPSEYTLSMFFTEEELRVCAGSSLYTLTTQLRGRVGDDYKKLLTSVFMRHRDLFPLDKFSFQDYKWALSSVWSRSMDFAISEGNSVRLIAPFADMLNHAPDAKQCHAYDMSTGGLSVLACRDYQVGDQVFIYYGSIANSRLLRLYGFVLPGNPIDNYELVLQTSSMAPLYEQKQRLWKLAGLDEVSTIPLTLKTPLPDSVLRYLRIQRLDESELGAMTMQIATESYKKISDENESQILQFLSESIGALLEGFEIPLEKLEVQLAEGLYSPGSNAWAAAHVSLGEQRVLKAAKEKTDVLLASVADGSASLPPTKQCANCSRDSEAARLMACGKCRAVKYCGRECQVAHFKEHKALCRSLSARKERDI